MILATLPDDELRKRWFDQLATDTGTSPDQDELADELERRGGRYLRPQTLNLRPWAAVKARGIEVPARFGTALVVIITPDRVVAAADSLEVSGDLEELGRATKILAVGPYCMAVWGLSGRDETRYDFRTIAEEAFGGSGSLEGRIASLKKSIMDPLVRSISEIRDENPKHYEGRIRGQPAVGMFLFGMRGKKPFLMSLRFIARECGSTFEIDLERSNFTSDQHPPYVGPKPIMTKLLGQYGKEGFHGDPEFVAHEFIEACIKIDRQRYGPPVTVVEVSAGGVRWASTGSQA